MPDLGRLRGGIQPDQGDVMTRTAFIGMGDPDREPEVDDRFARLLLWLGFAPKWSEPTTDKLGVPFRERVWDGPRARVARARQEADTASRLAAEAQAFAADGKLRAAKALSDRAHMHSAVSKRLYDEAIVYSGRWMVITGLVAFVWVLAWTVVLAAS